MPMASQDPLPQAIDFLNQCEKCHAITRRDLYLLYGDYVCKECYKERSTVHTVYNYKKIEITYSNAREKSIYGWTKWYGANNNLFVLTPEWTCQACGDRQTNELPSYLIRIKDQEYARICSVCLHIALKHKINNIFKLIKKVKKPHKDF